MSVQEIRQRVRRSLKIDREAIFQRVKKFYDQDLQARDADREIRLQRYAKFRMWVGTKDWPWENASNIPLSDMLEHSLRSQDTIHNAVMSNRPVIDAHARTKGNKGKEQIVEDLIDYQVFEENSGEKIVGDAADAFINDGVITIFCPWVEEEREVSDLRVFDPIPEGVTHTEYFRSLIAKSFPRTTPRPMQNGWDFNTETEAEKKVFIQFYTRDDDRVEMVVKQQAQVFCGPSPRVIDYDDILHPTRCENLQIPGPHNPGGAAHVILIDNPSVDEIRRLKKSGFYNMMTNKDVEDLVGLTPEPRSTDEEDNKDNIDGKNDEPKKKEKTGSHTKLTRLLCFDTYDIDGDGIDEDVMFWVILELKKVVRASFLGEMYPHHPPRRPFAEAALIPIRGRRTGISMLEILEGLHDVKKAVLDQAVDGGTLANVPFFFYRAVAGVRPEVITLTPGDGYPVTDPQRDVHFPQIGNPNAMNFALNMTEMLTQMEEKATVIGDIQLGRVPPGRSSALRTASGLALLSGQGEARPERILRRFYMALVQLWELIHALNQEFLPKEKQYRIAGVTRKEKDPYREVEERDEIAGQFDFGFKASVLNLSKQALQEGIQMMMQAYVSDLAIQLGIVDAEGIYRMFRDYGRALGQDADAYLKEPQPGAGLPKLLVEEALSVIFQGGTPVGRTQEPATQHLQKLLEFMESEGNEIGLMTSDQVETLKEWMAQVADQARQEAERAQLQQAAQVFSAQQQNQGGRPPEGAQPDMNNPQVQGTELLNETLPSA